MTTSFHFDLNVLGAKKGGTSSPAPPSIVSMASDMFAAGFVDPEQFVPNSMSDLFEGALCDDEIPSLLNLAPAPGSGATSEEAMQLGNESSQSSKPSSSDGSESEQDWIPKGESAIVPIPPAPEAVVSVPVSPLQGQKKRVSIGQPPDAANKNQKKIKLAMAPRPPTTHMLQAIRPMTELPSSAQVRGRVANKNGVNTSTAHVKALTGANGAAVCLDAIERALQQSGTTNRTDSTVCSLDSSGAPLSSEEKAKQSRDRNRQHARNTRVRKKAYVEELKRTLNQLVEERDFIVHQKRMEQQGVLEQRDVRFRVIEDFLNLRGRNEADPNRWSMILEEGFQLRLPRCDVPGVVCSSGGTGNGGTNGGPCHSYPLGTSKKVLSGVNEVVEDSRLVASLLQSLGASSLSVSYQCDRESFMMDNANAVLNWMATSAGAVTKGANAEFSVEGSLRARFNPISNKLLHMEFSF